MNLETLVHITAPSTVHDDHRYHAITKAVLEFEAATVTRLSQFHIEPEESDYRHAATAETSVLPANAPLRLPESFPSYTQNYHQPSHSLVVANSGIKRKRIHSDNSSFGSADLNDHGAVKTGATEILHRSSQPHKTNRSPCQRTSVSCTTQKSKEMAVLCRDDPEGSRPQTAPEVPTKIVVPFTGNASRRRAMSDSLSFISDSMIIPDSQPAQRFFYSSASPRAKLQGSFSGVSPAFSTGQITPPPGDHSTSATTIDSTRDLAGPLGVHETLSLSDREPEKSKRIIETSSPKRNKSWLDNVSHCEDGMRYLLPVNKESLMRRNLEGMLVSASKRSNIALANPCVDHLQENTIAEERGFASDQASSSSILPSPINLVTPKSESGRKFPTFSASKINGLDINLPAQSQAERIQKAVQALEWKIDAPDLVVSTAKFCSSITPRLDIFERSLSIKEGFRPIQVQRDIKMLERGYWDVNITISDHVHVMKWRRTKALLRKETESEKLQNYPWTAAEFFMFYNRMVDSIRGSHFGYVNLYIVETKISCAKMSTEHVQIMLRLYSWGEAAAHLYMAMRWASDNLIRYLPIKWHGCDGKQVIQMAGEAHRGIPPRLGTWTQRSGKGMGAKFGMMSDQ